MYNFSRNFACTVARSRIEKSWPIHPEITAPEVMIIMEIDGTVTVSNEPERGHAYPLLVPNIHGEVQKLYEAGHLKILSAELAIRQVMESMLDFGAMYLIDVENEGFEKALRHYQLYRASIEAQTAAQRLSPEAKVFDVRHELERLKMNPLTF